MKDTGLSSQSPYFASKGRNKKALTFTTKIWLSTDKYSFLQYAYENDLECLSMENVLAKFLGPEINRRSLRLMRLEVSLLPLAGSSRHLYVLKTQYIAMNLLCLIPSNDFVNSEDHENNKN